MNLDLYFRGYAKINLDYICENVKALQKKLKENTGSIAVIKTDGYGHGAVPIAKVLSDIVDRYAVATVFEANNLIEHGIKNPIILLGYTQEATYDLAIEKEIRMVVYDYEMARKMNEHAEKLGKKALVNIALDTGMSRIGFLPTAESVDVIEQISKLDNIKLEGIFTHFAKADEYDKQSAKNQFDLYESFLKKLEDRGVNIPIKHCANSAAVMEMPYTSLNMSRLGIAIYGLYPSEEISREIELKQAMSLHSHVIYVKEVEAGSGISYGHTFIADKKMKIATIPLGYGDGYFRNLSNKGVVLIKGKRVPIVGRVCMDQFMVDVTGMDVSIGDEVTLIGKDGDEMLTVDEIAKLAGTFNYELVCDLGKRVPRVYEYKGKIVGTKDYFHDEYKINI
ncbi:MAG: alanine racemase [Lachnospiraceae bacterium]|nr:alanine racemase [Lachnospiraceae bacterium]